ncbi:MAG: class I SAM-dependent methyltransferase [Gammaproteobacteria bacterium]
MSLKSLKASERSVHTQPTWLAEIFGIDLPPEGEVVNIDGKPFIQKAGILRAKSLSSESQKQTEESFGFKWKKRETFDSEASLSRMRQWLLERYGDVCNAEWWSSYGDRPLLLDAGCGAGMSGIELFKDVLKNVRYLGADISEAVDVAAARFSEMGYKGGFIQADITDLPIPEGTVDVIFSEGVLHHTDSTENAVKKLAVLLKPNGRFLFYVYKRKGPVREFTDDYIRGKLQDLTPEEAWDKMIPITKLGMELGRLDITLDIPDEIELLEIPAGKIDLQRLFYWHVFKAFYHPDLSMEEMNHINYDWYAPANAYRQTIEEVRRWCDEAGMIIEREMIEDAGITIIARKQDI